MENTAHFCFHYCHTLGANISDSCTQTSTASKHWNCTFACSYVECSVFKLEFVFMDMRL